MGLTSNAENIAGQDIEIPEIKTAKAANDPLVPESRIEQVKGERGMDLDFEAGRDPNTEGIVAAEAAKVATVMDWKIVPKGALAQIRVNPEAAEVEVSMAEGLTQRHIAMIEKMVKRINESLWASLLDYQDREIRPKSVITVW